MSNASLKRVGKTGLWLGVIGVGFAILAYVGMLLLTATIDNPQAIVAWKKGISEKAWVFRCVRYTTWLLIIGAWPRIADRLSARGRWSQEERRAFMGYRWRALLWIVVIEVVVVENVVGRTLF